MNTNNSQLQKSLGSEIILSQNKSQRYTIRSKKHNEIKSAAV